LFKAMMLESVPHARLLIGLGLLNLMQLVLIVRALQKGPRFHAVFVAVYILAIFGFNILIGLSTRTKYPGFIHIVPLIIILAAFPAAVVGLFMYGKLKLAATVLLVFSAGSAGIVHPLYRGLGPLYHSQIVSQVRSVSTNDPTARWGVSDLLIYENVPALAGARNITGVYAYPQKSVWDRSRESAKQTDSYNRYAHSLVKFTPSQPIDLYLKQPDYFEITGSPCDQFYQDENVRYFLTPKDYSKSYNCLKVIRTITYPNKTFYILKRQ
jgi:hypothetical protein